jgi:hypothetical protein
VATGDVEWPDELDSSGNRKLDSDRNPIGAALAPHGPQHHYAPLLLVTPGTKTKTAAARSTPCSVSSRVGSQPCLRDGAGSGKVRLDGESSNAVSRASGPVSGRRLVQRTWF